MKVILLENVRKVGSIGDVIEAKRICKKFFNFKKALFASKKILKKLKKLNKI